MQTREGIAECVQHVDSYSPYCKKNKDASNNINNRVLTPSEIEFLKELCNTKIDGFKAQEVANTLWALATLGIKDDLLFSKLASKACQIAEQFTAQGIANTLWAFAIGEFQSSHSDTLVERLLAEFDPTTAHGEDIHQIYFFLAHHRYLQPSKAKDAFKESLRKQTENRITATSFHTSAIQERVYKELCQLYPKLKFELEKFIPSVGISFDIAEVEKKINIEIDGRYHFLADGTQRPADVVTDKKKEARGWKVLRVNIEGKSIEEIVKELSAKLEKNLTK